MTGSHLLCGLCLVKIWSALLPVRTTFWSLRLETRCPLWEWTLWLRGRSQAGYGTRGHSFFCFTGSRLGQREKHLAPWATVLLSKVTATGSEHRLWSQANLDWNSFSPLNGGLASEPQSPNLENGNAGIHTCLEGLVREPSELMCSALK